VNRALVAVVILRRKVDGDLRAPSLRLRLQNAPGGRVPPQTSRMISIRAALGCIDHWSDCGQYQREAP